MRPDLHNISRRFALGAISDCLMGKNLTCSVPALLGREGVWLNDSGAMHGMILPPLPPPGARGVSVSRLETLKMKPATPTASHMASYGMWYTRGFLFLGVLVGISKIAVLKK